MGGENNVVQMKQYISSVRDLLVYQRAFQIALAVHRITLKFPKIEQYALADQLRRSTKSICANLSEGFGRQHESKLEFKRYIIIALGSCNESETWLEFAQALGYINQQECTQWCEELTVIGKMLFKLKAGAGK